MLRCQLCGNSHFREDEDGLWCRGCGASMSGPPSDNWSPFNTFAASTEREAISREDADALLDMWAAEGVGRYRGMGR